MVTHRHFSFFLDFFQIVFLPPNTTSILQPMDQLVIANFKKLYTKLLFDLFFDKCRNDPTEMNVTKFWKEGYDILECVLLIFRAWTRVTERTLTSAWKPLMPSFSIEEVDPEVEAEIVQDIVATARRLNMDVEAEDVDELIQESVVDLNVDDLRDLAAEEADDVVEIEAEQEEQPIPSADLREFLRQFKEVKEFVATHRFPRQLEAQETLNRFEDEAVLHFRRMLQGRERQTTISRFFTPAPRSGPSGAGPSGAGPSGAGPSARPSRKRQAQRPITIESDESD